MSTTTRNITGHLAMFHASWRDEPTPIWSPIAAVTGPVTTRAREDGGGQHHQDQGEEQHDGPQLPDRAPSPTS